MGTTPCLLNTHHRAAPCPFTGDESPYLTEPSQESWKKAAGWVKTRMKEGTLRAADARKPAVGIFAMNWSRASMH